MRKLMILFLLFSCTCTYSSDFSDQYMCVVDIDVTDISRPGQRRYTRLFERKSYIALKAHTSKTHKFIEEVWFRAGEVGLLSKVREKDSSGYDVEIEEVNYRVDLFKTYNTSTQEGVFAVHMMHQTFGQDFSIAIQRDFIRSLLREHPYFSKNEIILNEDQIEKVAKLDLESLKMSFPSSHQNDRYYQRFQSSSEEVEVSLEGWPKLRFLTSASCSTVKSIPNIMTKKSYLRVKMIDSLKKFKKCSKEFITKYHKVIDTIGDLKRSEENEISKSVDFFSRKCERKKSSFTFKS